jgi:hypothetical protein
MNDLGEIAPFHATMERLGEAVRALLPVMRELADLLARGDDVINRLPVMRLAAAPVVRATPAAALPDLPEDERSRSGSPWTAARCALFVTLWRAGGVTDAMRARLNALPGRPIQTVKALEMRAYAQKLGPRGGLAMPAKPVPVTALPVPAPLPPAPRPAAPVAHKPAALPVPQEPAAPLDALRLRPVRIGAVHATRAEIAAWCARQRLKFDGDMLPVNRLRALLKLPRLVCVEHAEDAW